MSLIFNLFKSCRVLIFKKKSKQIKTWRKRDKIIKNKFQVIQIWLKIKYNIKYLVLVKTNLIKKSIDYHHRNKDNHSEQVIAIPLSKQSQLTRIQDISNKTTICRKLI
jgi:hypothetical protein